MQLQTAIEINPLEQTVRYGDGLLFLGSCFADEVGAICKGFGFDAMVNPFGVLYNPASIVRALKLLDKGTPFTHEDVIEVGSGYYCTFNHNTSFWKPSEKVLKPRFRNSPARNGSRDE